MKNLWIAELETRHTKSRGFGETPEAAVQAMLDMWRDKWVPQSDADPDYPIEIRDEIEVSQFRIGEAYLLGPTDHLWHKTLYRGSDSRFDSILVPRAAPGGPSA